MSSGEIEGYPLNLAHQQHRRADAHLINNKFDEAMKCHQNAAELLLDAMKTTSCSAALESITLQHTYHLKQKDLIKSKKEQHARVKKAVDQIKQCKESYNVEGNKCLKLQVALFKMINDTDTLLQDLAHNKDINQVITKESDEVDGGETQITVIDQIQMNIHNVQPLVERLQYQVELLKDENASLKERVNYLEKERVRYLNLPSSYGDVSQKSYFQVGSANEDFIAPLSKQANN